MRKKGIKTCVKVAFATLSLLVMASCSSAWEYELVDYTLKLYYLGGSTEVRKIPFKGDDKPYISSYKGSYWLASVDRYIDGVVRFEILSKSEPYIMVNTNDGKWLTPQQAKEQGYYIFIRH